MHIQIILDTEKYLEHYTDQTGYYSSVPGPFPAENVACPGHFLSSLHAKIHLSYLRKGATFPKIMNAPYNPLLAVDMYIYIYIYMLWFNFILGLNFIFLCFKLIIIHYHTQKQREIKFKPRIKLNHNIYINGSSYYMGAL